MVYLDKSIDDKHKTINIKIENDKINAISIENTKLYNVATSINIMDNEFSSKNLSAFYELVSDMFSKIKEEHLREINKRNKKNLNEILELKNIRDNRLQNKTNKEIADSITNKEPDNKENDKLDDNEIRIYKPIFD